MLSVLFRLGGVWSCRRWIITFDERDAVVPVGVCVWAFSNECVCIFSPLNLVIVIQLSPAPAPSQRAGTIIIIITTSRCITPPSLSLPCRLHALHHPLHLCSLSSLPQSYFSIFYFFSFSLFQKVNMKWHFFPFLLTQYGMKWWFQGGFYLSVIDWMWKAVFIWPGRHYMRCLYLSKSKVVSEAEPSCDI